jgi:hypothetical protein
MIASVPSTFTYERGIKKIVFSGDPAATSNGCILAALNVKPCGMSLVSVCRVGCLNGGWSTWLWRGDSIWDITFSNGELYGLTHVPEILVRFEIKVEEGGAPVITAAHHPPIQKRFNNCGYNPTEYDSYIVELNGKIMMAVRSWWLPRHKPFFRVFEIVDVHDHKYYKHKWVEVTGFGDYALFLGWSKAVHLPDGERCGIKRNHIYYYRPTLEHELPDDKVYFATSANDDQIYCREDHSINDGVERIGYYLMRYKAHMWLDRSRAVAWIYPPDF